MKRTPFNFPLSPPSAADIRDEGGRQYPVHALELWPRGFLLPLVKAVWASRVLVVPTVLAASLVAGWAVPVSAKSVGEDFAPGTINVKTFGAVGDGQTDDTSAIQGALNAACDFANKNSVRVRHWRHLKSGIKEWALPIVVFPAGHYRVTQTLVLTQPVILRGIETALIEQMDPGKDIFYFHSLRSAWVNGLVLRGGKIQLRFFTNNIDVSQITIRGCRFEKAGGYAVECRSYTQEKFEGKESQLNTIRPWAPYAVTWKDGLPILEANPSDHLREWFNSTLLAITGCQFIDCAGVADMQCDTGLIEDCQIEANPESDGAIFSLPSGKTALYRIKGVVHKNPRKDTYWIEGGGILSVRDCDFETEGPEGIDFFRASEIRRWVSLQIGHFCVELENSRMKAGGGSHNAICWFSKKNQPSILSLRGVTETSGRPVQAAVWEEAPTAEMLQELLPPGNPLNIPVWFYLQFADNSQNISVDIPEILSPSLEAPIPREILAKVRIPDLPWDFDDFKKGTTRWVNASDFGLKPGSKEDASNIIQKVFDEAGKLEAAKVIFPPGIYKISNTIQLPPHVVAEAAGRVVIEGTNPDVPLFSSGKTENIGFHGFVFDGGKDAFDLAGSDHEDGRVAFLECSFFDQTGAGIRYLAKEGHKNLGEISVAGGMLGTTQGLVTDAVRAQVKRAYFVNDPHLNEAAFLENRGGAMKIEACLAIPQLWEGRRNKRPETLKSWDFSRNTRWVDNFRRLEILDTRLGGESGGMANIFHRAEGGSVFVAGGTKSFKNGITKKALVYLQKEPDYLVLQNVSSVPVSIEGSLSVLAGPGVSINPGMFYHAGLMSPLPAVKTAPAPPQKE